MRFYSLISIAPLPSARSLRSITEPSRGASHASAELSFDRHLARVRLALENLSLENISERVRLAKEMGATNRDLAPLLNELIYKPLVALDRYQDKGIIKHAEIPPDSDRK